MHSKQSTNFLAGYSLALTEQVQQLIAQDQLAGVLLKKYPLAHSVRSDKALFDYVLELKSEYLRNAAPLSKVVFDSKLHVIQHALGTHTRSSRVQGINLKTKREIRLAAVFKEVPAEFLRMIVVHELAHVKEREHDKAFYQLCRYMEPDYHQLEFDLRTYLTFLEVSGKSLWSAAGVEVGAI
jgi:predicted metal-dependent hydrolase